jgi:hypothetical protein
MLSEVAAKSHGSDSLESASTSAQHCMINCLLLSCEKVMLRLVGDYVYKKCNNGYWQWICHYCNVACVVCLVVFSSMSVIVFVWLCQSDLASMN